MKAVATTVGALLLASTAIAGSAHAANIIDTTSTYIASGNTTLVNSTGFDFKPIDFSKSVSVGKVYGSSYFGHYGAKVTATVGAKLDLNGSMSFSNSFALNNIGVAHTVAGGQTTPGSSFVLYTDLDTPSVVMGVGKGQVDASLNATAFAGANIHGKACVVECISGDIANLGIGSPYQTTIVGYQSETNSVTFLGQEHHDVLPQHYDGGSYVPITADVNPINLAGVGTGAFNSGTATYHTKQTVAGAYIDVAGAIANAFGVPTDALHGTVLGFDYTTVAAKVGAALNAVYDVSSKVVDAGVNYVFSTSMQIYSAKKGAWLDVGKSVLNFDGDLRELRTKDPTVTSVSVLPMAYEDDSINTTLSITASLEDHIKLLEVSGHGLDAGPLYKQDASVNLGTIASFSKLGFANETVAMKPFTLDFGSASKLNTVAGFATDAGAEDDPVGSAAFVFVPSGEVVDNAIDGVIKLALNYGTTGCDDTGIGRCIYDPTFDPIPEQERVTRDPTTGLPTYTYAADFSKYDMLIAAGDGPQGMQATDRSIQALLDSLPGANHSYDTGQDIAFNSTPFIDGFGAPDPEAVPEPGPWAMLIGGTGLIGGAMRRRRRGERGTGQRAVIVTA